MEGLERAIEKLKLFVIASMCELGASPEQIANFRDLLDQPTMVYILAIRKFLGEHRAAIEARDIPSLRPLLPAEYQNREIPKSITDKGFLFADCFAELYRALDAEEDSDNEP